jgi:heavy metal translocating P-type ATPase
MEKLKAFWRNESLRTLSLTIASGFFLLASFLKWLPGLPFDPAWAAIAISGLPIVYGAIRGLVTDFDLSADLLVALALVSALCIGEYFAAGEVAFIMRLGEVLEELTAARSRKSVEALVRLAPERACRLTARGEEEVPVSELKEGDVLLVRPGASIPVDGLVLRGSTSVDQSPMTGESLPVDKGSGDPVYQGSLNQEGSIEIRATAVGEDSSLRKMVRLVEEAEKNKAPIVRLADSWARVLVPFALGSALLIWLVSGEVRRAVTALVVFCPCSLVLATPAAIAAAIGNATRHGILIKSGAAVEAVSRLDTFVMDKTGTLSYGRPEVEELALLDPGIDRESLIGLAASAEKYSEHPLGKAIVAYAGSQGIAAEAPERFEARSGRGVAARVGGREVLVGEKAVGRALMEESPGALGLAAAMEAGGKTVLPVALDGMLVGLLGMADTLWVGAPGAVAGLGRAGIRRIVMLTGDNEAVAGAIGRAAGIGEVRASLLPADKVKAIRRLSAEGRRVAMLGDGVNDAPALAAASVGIVMGAIGSEVSIEAADIALMGDDISKLPFLLALCRRARSRIVFNIVFSMCLNFGAMVLAGLGVLNPVTAALVHNCGSVFVVVNSAMLLAYREGGGIDVESSAP